MLTKEETDFIRYWEENRVRKKKVVLQLSVGLPLSVALVMAIFINFFSGWYRRADMAMRSGDRSLFMVLLVAAFAIIIFLVIFSARHRWEMHEQRYKELISRRNNP